MQMPLDIRSEKEDGERKVQNICNDSGDVYLVETATKEPLFVREKKMSIMLHKYRLWDPVCMKIVLSENFFRYFCMILFRIS
jgi:hypothetical protein